MDTTLIIFTGDMFVSFIVFIALALFLAPAMSLYAMSSASTSKSLLWSSLGVATVLVGFVAAAANYFSI
jgi:hypothetical protein